jgi:hypothetical protein
MRYETLGELSEFVDYKQGVTKRCGLSLLTNSELVYKREGGGLRGLSQ